MMKTIQAIVLEPIYVSLTVGAGAVLCFIIICSVIRKHNRSAKYAATVGILEGTVGDEELLNTYLDGNFNEDIPSPPGFVTPTSKGNYSCASN